MKRSRNLATLLVTIMASAGALLAADPVPQRQDAASSPAAAIRAQMDARLKAWTSAAMDDTACAKAADAISAVPDAIYQSIQEPADADPEVKLRLKEVRADLLMTAELKRAQASLSPARRKELAAFAERNRAGFDSIFTGNPNYALTQLNLVDAFVPTHLLPIKEASPENETVLIACLLYGSKRTAVAAAEMVNGSGLKSPELIDALTRAVVYPIAAGYCPEASRQNIYGTIEFWLSSLAAIEYSGAKRAAPVLLTAMLKGKKLSLNSYLADSAMAQTLATAGDHRMIPVLLTEIDKRLPKTATIPVGGDNFVSDADPLIECAHRLIGAGPAMTRANFANTQVLIFKRDADRQDAIEKIRQFVSKSQPASDAQPLVVPDLEQWLRSAATATAPATAPAGKAETFSPAEAQALARLVAQACQSAVKDLGSERLIRRQAAQKTIGEIYAAYLDALITCADRPEEARLANVLLDRSAAQSVFESLRPNLVEETAKRLLEARKSLPREFDEVFALETLRCIAGIRALARVDADRKPAAEGLILFCMKYHVEDISIAAMAACAGGKYSSEEIIAALVERMVGNPGSFNWVQRYYAPQHAWPQTEALEALKEIRTPLAISAIVSNISSASNYDQYRTLALGDALVEIGDKSAIGSLMQMIDSKRGGPGAWNLPQGKKMTSTDGDEAMYVVLTLTEQQPEDYGMIYYDNALGTGMQSPRVYGFESSQDRAKAITKLRQWWEENKSRQPYDKLKALPEAPKPKKPAARPEPAARPDFGAVLVN